VSANGVSGRRWREQSLVPRVLSGLVLAPLAVAAVWLGGWVLTGLLAVIVLTATAEFLLMARRAGIPVRFLATYGRDFGVKGNEATTRGVLGTSVFSGLDLAGNEAVSALPFVPLFRKLELPVTIHAGEAGGAANVRQAIEKFGALRIGHGVRAFGDAELLRLARRKKIHFELCPTSNLQTGAARDWDRHPAWEAWDLGIDCSLNTDDPSISGVRLQDEYEHARRAGWNEVHLQYSSVNAASAAFIPSRRERAALIRSVQEAWRKARGIIVPKRR